MERGRRSRSAMRVRVPTRHRAAVSRLRNSTSTWVAERGSSRSTQARSTCTPSAPASWLSPSASAFRRAALWLRGAG